LCDLLFRLTFYVMARFRFYRRELTVAEFASNQCADLSELLALLYMELVEFGHCSNPPLLAAASLSPLELRPSQNNHSKLRVPTLSGQHSKNQWRNGPRQ